MGSIRVQVQEDRRHRGRGVRSMMVWRVDVEVGSHCYSAGADHIVILINMSAQIRRYIREKEDF